MNKNITSFKEKYLDFLENQFAPYWLDLFDDDGAIINCIAEDKTIQSYDRYIWSQGRALWTFSAFYNRIKKDEKYLRRADGLFSYLSKMADKVGDKWNYRYDRDGNVLDDDISIYVDGFVLTGMTEYYLATGNERAKEIGLKIYESTRKRLATPGSYRIAPYVIPEGMQTHGINMIFSYFYYNFGKAIQNQEICKAGLAFADEVLNRFYNEERDIICEFIHIDGSYKDTSMERACVPGHVIECMWFLLTIYNDIKDQEKIKKCCHIIKKHIEYGWDKENGGLCLAFDTKGIEPCFWDKNTYKPWWVQIETMVATLSAYIHTRDSWFLDMHEIVSDYTFERYPNGFGDFINWLDKDGNIAPTAALPVKDPFHLPRALMMCIEYAEKIEFLNQ